ncbi:MAG TPA: Ku protein [Lacipirellula sp.]
MPRASWKGFIRLSLVSVPVEGYTASAAGETQISLNQLHEDCGARIRYKKVCEVHGEVENDQIVMGYQYAKDQYAVIDPDELDKLRTEADRSINVDRFVDPETIDPIFFAGKTYYLTPNGRAGEKPYALLNRAMSDENVVGLAQVVISNREQLVALRPIGKVLAISVMQYVDNVRQPEEFEKMLPDSDVSSQELKLAKTLIAATRADSPELEEYRDLYNDRLKELVEAKVEGHEVATPPKSAEPPVINLMDALRASLQKRAKGAPKKAARKAAKKAASRKRKTG